MSNSPLEQPLDRSRRAALVATSARVPAMRVVLEQVGLDVEVVTTLPEALAHDPSIVLVESEVALVESAELVTRDRGARVWALIGEDADSALLTLASQLSVDAILVTPVDAASARWLMTLRPRAAASEEKSSAPLPSAIVGSSDAMSEVWRLALLAARSSASVLVTGETGVGKEVVARTLHRFSSRRSARFVAVNCAALPETLLDSALFGHEKGAFTGATAQREGRFELADGGTLFLDEVGELPLEVQAKLLRVLQERRFERVGGTQTIEVDVRIVAASNRDLQEEVRCGRFRADLFYRLNVLAIRVPPLRDRPEDVLGLWEHFVRDAAISELRPPPATSTAARALLLRHSWLGNVREVSNAARHAVTVARGDTLEPSELPAGFCADSDRLRAMPSLLGIPMSELERMAILQTHRALGSARATADALGLSLRKVQYRLKAYRAEGWLTADEDDSPNDSPDSAPTRKRILLAEDDDELRWVLVDFLESEGHEVAAVGDGRGLLAALAAPLLGDPSEVPADLIITDLRMPGITGLQLLESARSHGWLTPIVLITAFGDHETRHRAKMLGATAFLDKPFDVARLRGVIEGALTR